MNAAASLILALFLLLGTGKVAQEAMKKIEVISKARIKKGLSPLSRFTSRLSCLSYTGRGELIEVHSGNCKKK